MEIGDKKETLATGSKASKFIMQIKSVNDKSQELVMVGRAKSGESC